MHAFGWQLHVDCTAKRCFCEDNPIAIAAKSAFSKEKIVMLASCLPIVFFLDCKFLWAVFMGENSEKTEQILSAALH